MRAEPRTGAAGALQTDAAAGSPEIGALTQRLPGSTQWVQMHQNESGLTASSPWDVSRACLGFQATVQAEGQSSST